MRLISQLEQTVSSNTPPSPLLRSPKQGYGKDEELNKTIHHCLEQMHLCLKLYNINKIVLIRLHVEYKSLFPAPGRKGTTITFTSKRDINILKQSETP